MYESWIVDECGELICRASTMTDNEINDYLINHPEHRVMCVFI